MPVYNAEKYVSEAIESILNQTYADFEFIIIDDCSTDTSYQILQKYSAMDKRIKLLKNSQNSKLPKTLNKGISESIGKYIARMDADDISLPDRFSEQVEFMESHPDIGVCGTWIKEFLNDTSNIVRIGNDYPTDSEQIMTSMLFYGCSIAHPTVIIRREVLSSLNLKYDESLAGVAEDYDLWTRLLCNGVKFANLPNFLLLYRKSTTQVTAVSSSSIGEHSNEIIRENFKKYFGGYVSDKQLNSYLKFKFISKKRLSVFQHVHYQWLLYLLIKINKRYKLFNQQYFTDLIKRDSMVMIGRRFLKKRFSIGR